MDNSFIMEIPFVLLPSAFQQQNYRIKAGAADAGIQLFRGSIRRFKEKGNMVSGK